jgi:hypothetical protein
MMTQLTIDSVQRDFNAWRASRTKTTRIPEDLWDKTLKLLEHYPISKVVQALRLSGGQVSAKRKQQLALNSNALPLKNPVNFVELNIPSITSPHNTPIRSSRIEIKRSDGAVLAIEHFNDQTLLQIFNQFMRGTQSCYN